MGVRGEPVRVRIEGVTPLSQIFDLDPVDEGLALEEIAREFEAHAYSWSATAWVSPAEGFGGRALVFRRPRQVLHVVGTSKVAETFRELLRSGAVSGWTLHEVPAARTLLEVAESTLGHRAYNLLSREGFTTLEELAATPDEGLMELRNLGEKSLAAIHQAVDTYVDCGIAHPSTVAEHEQRRERIEAALSPAHRVRNSRLLELLAHSSVPLEAVDAILASLEAEPVPPVDPMVSLLLRTAGEPDIAALYERAHAQAPEADA